MPLPLATFINGGINMRKIKRVGTISEFMEPKEVRQFNKKFQPFGAKAAIVAGTLSVTLSPASLAGAAGIKETVETTAKEKISEAFAPLIELVQGLSYPIAAVMLTGGAIMFMINQKDRGISMIQNASIGYILVQMMPMFLQILVGLA